MSAYKKGLMKGGAEHQVLLGNGIINDISNLGKKVVGVVKEGASKVGDYFSRVANMKNSIPPNVKKALDEIGDKPITSARVGRTPVQALVQGALRTVVNVPYDNLFHLFIELNIEGRTWVLEKIERITLVAEDRSQKQGAEFTDIANVGVGGETPTMNELFLATQDLMGKRFLPYQSNSNNCQVFIDSVLTANGLNTPTLKEFIKQDTRTIFKNNPVLRKFANTLTDIGGYFNAALQGGELSEGNVPHADLGRFGNAVSNLLDPKRMNVHINNGLSDTELDTLAKHFNIKLNGIYEKSEVDALPYGNYIINLNGTSHWCGMIIHPKGNYWYDSYGFPAPANLQKLMCRGKENPYDRNEDGYIWSDKQIQDINSTACGYFVIAFLKFMERPSKERFNTFCDLFGDPKKNDKIIFSLLT